LKNPRLTQPRAVSGSFVGDFERFCFEQLERNCLRKHDVGCDEPTLREEAQEAHAIAGTVEFLDVHLVARSDKIPRTRVSTDDLEVSSHFALSALAWRQILLKELGPSRLQCLFDGAGVPARNARCGE